MAEVPKIVGQRLRAAGPVEGHPDANVLTAFAERTLRVPERDFVLEHLARCDDCREVVALSLPASELESEQVQQVVRPARAGWFTAPILRWGALAAAVLVVATVAMRRNQTEKVATFADARVAQKQQETAKSSAQDMAPALEAMKPAAPPAAALTDRAYDSKDVAKADQPMVREFAKRPSEGLVAGGAMGRMNGPAEKKDLPRRDAAASASGAFSRTLDEAKAVPSRVPPASAIGGNAWADKQAAAGAAPTQAGSSANAVEVQADAGPKVPTLPSAGRNELVLKEKEEEDRMAEEPSAPEAAEGFSRAKVPMLPAPAPRWVVKAGALQRSLDAGRTWQAVNVEELNGNASPGAEYAYAASESVEVSAKSSDAKSSAAKVSTPKVSKKKLSASGLVFSAVVASTLEVWAGGKAGFLYHSADGGNSWTRVVPSDAGEMLTSDIGGIEVADAQHIKIVSTRVWSTADGGKTWRKQ